MNDKKYNYLILKYIKLIKRVGPQARRPNPFNPIDGPIHMSPHPNETLGQRDLQADRGPCTHLYVLHV